jgi:spermidine synthase
LAAGQAQGFDVLVLDAFASDAIPMHLLTRQAFELYSGHLNPDGILVFHVTSVYVDLKALVRGTAKRLGYESLWIDWHPRQEAGSADDTLAGFEGNTWIVATRNGEFLRNADVRYRVTPWEEYPKADVVWTDDYGSLLQVLRY